MSDAPDPLNPREPEIEFLARVVRRFLFVLRCVLWLAGAAAVAYAIWKMFIEEHEFGIVTFDSLFTGWDPGRPGPEPGFENWTESDWRSFYAELREDGVIESFAAQFVWFCPGLVLMSPADTFFTRKRWWLLGASVLIWFAPMLLPDDSRYGYILRMFATLSSFLTIFVWRTLWRLTKPIAKND